MTTIQTPLDKVCQLLSQSQGIDKAYRVLVYGLLLLDTTKNPGANADASLLGRLQRLRPVLGETRVVLRLFGLLPILNAGWKAVQASSDEVTESSEKEIWTRRLQIGQLLSMLVYYPYALFFVTWFPIS